MGGWSSPEEFVEHYTKRPQFRKYRNGVLEVSHEIPMAGLIVSQYTIVWFE
jgi:hypothetical protein